MVNILRICIIAAFALILISACASASEYTPPPHPEPTVVQPPTASDTSQPIESTKTQSTTQNDLSGNHITSGSMDIQNAAIIDIQLEGKPIWLVSAVLNESVIFVAIMEDGKAQAFQVTGQSYDVIEITPAQLPTGMPPLLTISDDKPQLTVPPSDASTVTNPIILENKFVYIALNGDLVVNETRLSVNALLDSRILVDENSRLLVLSQPTNRYDHGVLGDELEASGITLIETETEVKVAQTITLEETDVVEGISAIWADMDNDGDRDIIVTLSNNQDGARLAAFNEDGTLLAESDPIGLGHRWRHQIAVAQFEANKPSLLVSVRIPHIGGIIEFFQYNNGRLEIVKEFKGFSTHSIGSRNLDSAFAADFNNDGIFELLAPDQSHTNLGVISINGVLATLPLGGALTSNISAMNAGGKLYIGAGTQDKIRIWVP